MKEIPLTQGRVALVDDEDYAELSQFKWCAHRNNRGIYAVRNAHHNNKWTTELMHRRILNARADQEVDHVNHDGLDNRRDNIRLCTGKENQRNQKKQKRTTSSKYKGVHWFKRDKKWRAQIQRNRGNIYLGLFDDEEAAALAYDVAAKRLFGKYALLNFPHGH